MSCDCRVQGLLEGMNQFLRQMEITFRRDPENYRPRINKMDRCGVLAAARVWFADCVLTLRRAASKTRSRKLRARSFSGTIRQRFPSHCFASLHLSRHARGRRCLRMQCWLAARKALNNKKEIPANAH